MGSIRFLFAVFRRWFLFDLLLLPGRQLVVTELLLLLWPQLNYQWTRSGQLGEPLRRRRNRHCKFSDDFRSLPADLPWNLRESGAFHFEIRYYGRYRIFQLFWGNQLL